MTQQAAKQLCLDIMRTKAAIHSFLKDCGDFEECRVWERELCEMKTQVKEYLENQGLFGDWDDDAENLVACGFSKNQSEFILAAQEQGIELTSYSGRGRFDEYYPAALEEVKFDGNVLSFEDPLGMGVVHYVRY